MKFSYFTNENCDHADGVVVVIDVLRAFSTAAYAFGAGAKSIKMVGEVEEALALKAQMANALIMGEVNGIKPESFDYGNSPTEITLQNLAGKNIAHIGRYARRSAQRQGRDSIHGQFCGRECHGARYPAIGAGYNLIRDHRAVFRWRRQSLR